MNIVFLDILFPGNEWIYDGKLCTEICVRLAVLNVLSSLKGE